MHKYSCVRKDLADFNRLPNGCLVKKHLPNWKPFWISDFTASAALPKARRTICTTSLPDALHLRQTRKSLNLGQSKMHHGADLGLKTITAAWSFFR